MNKNESKYFNTAKKMDEALLALLEKKDFAYITVKEICDTAGVNRSTFYLHYENTAELLRETTEYVLDKHFAYYDVEMRDVAVNTEAAECTELIFITAEYLTPYLTFIKENRRMFKVSMKQFNTMRMGSVYEKLFKDVFEPVLLHFGVPQNERPYVIKFYLTGIYAIVNEWLDGDCAEDVGLMIKIINDCVLGARDLYGQNT